jgi:hypothetical protein
MKLFQLARFISRRFPGVSPARTTQRQKRVALVIAAAVDLVQVALAPLFAEGALSPFADVLDALAAGILFLALGRSWRLAFALGLELIPGAALFPTWTAVVATLPTSPELVESPALVPTRG